MLEFAGEFETHITIQSGEHTSGDRLARWANLHGFRVHEIVLDRGRTPLQPMLTSRCQGRLSRVLVETESAARMLTLEGFLSRESNSKPRHPMPMFRRRTRTRLVITRDILSIT